MVNRQPEVVISDAESEEGSLRRRLDSLDRTLTPPPGSPPSRTATLRPAVSASASKVVKKRKRASFYSASQTTAAKRRRSAPSGGFATQEAERMGVYDDDPEDDDYEPAKWHAAAEDADPAVSSSRGQSARNTGHSASERDSEEEEDAEAVDDDLGRRRSTRIQRLVVDSEDERPHTRGMSRAASQRAHNGQAGPSRTKPKAQAAKRVRKADTPQSDYAESNGLTQIHDDFADPAMGLDDDYPLPPLSLSPPPATQRRKGTGRGEVMVSVEVPADGEARLQRLESLVALLQNANTALATRVAELEKDNSENLERLAEADDDYNKMVARIQTLEGKGKGRAV